MLGFQLGISINADSANLTNSSDFMNNLSRLADIPLPTKISGKDIYVYSFFGNPDMTPRAKNGQNMTEVA